MLENYYRELVYFLNAKLGNRQVAEDVVHDAYLRVLERSSDTPIEQPRAFLYRTALNLVIDDHRRNALRQVESLDVLDTVRIDVAATPPLALLVACGRDSDHLLVLVLDELRPPILYARTAIAFGGHHLPPG